ncbi:MAG: hypothetical protein ACLT8E_03280 [Akkermansia sp.]
MMMNNEIVTVPACGFRGGLMAQVLGFFPDVCQLFHGLLLDEHGLGKALDGQFPGNGTFYYFRSDGGGDHSSDEAPEAFVVHVTHGNVLIGFIRPWRHAAASFPEGLDYIQSSLHFFSVPPYSGQDELAETNF